MIEGLAFIVFLLVIASFVCTILAIITPKSFAPLIKKELSRGKTALIFSGVTFGLFILFMILVVNSPTSTTQTQQGSKDVTSAHSSPTILPTKVSVTVSTAQNVATQPKKPKSTSTPERNALCDNDHTQTMDFDTCLRLRYPLNAKVTADVTNFYVTNPTNTNWTTCSAQFDSGSFEMNLYDDFDVAAGSTTAVAWGRLIDGNNNRFDYTQKQPEPLDVSCNVGNDMRESQFQGF